MRGGTGFIFRHFEIQKHGGRYISTTAMSANYGQMCLIMPLIISSLFKISLFQSYFISLSEIWQSNAV